MMAPALVASSGVFKTSLTMKDTYPQYHPCWWFDNYLPEPYRSQAIENYDEGFSGEYEALRIEYALIIGFSWRATPTDQGDEYWRSVHARAKSGEFNTPLP